LVMEGKTGNWGHCYFSTIKGGRTPGGEMGYRGGQSGQSVTKLVGGYQGLKGNEGNRYTGGRRKVNRNGSQNVCGRKYLEEGSITGKERRCVPKLGW